MPHDLKNNPFAQAFADVLQRYGSMFAIYDETDGLVFANSAAYDAMPTFFNALDRGLTSEAATRKQIFDLNPGIKETELEAATEEFAKRQLSDEPFEIPCTKGRTFRVYKDTINAKYTLTIGVDVTKLRKQQGTLEKLADENFKLANTDQLSGLANRRQFIKVLYEKILEARYETKIFHIGLMDLNNFKRVNDLFGHTIGDELLKACAKRAASFIDERTFLARLGGDEFAFILEGNYTTQDLIAYGAALCETVSQPQHISGNDIRVGASIGWTSFPKDSETASGLLRKSDYALYKSKASKTERSVVFSSTDERVMLRQSDISIQLETACLEDEIYMEFQPIHDAKFGLIKSFEALARWKSPSLGFISPLEFIPLAEKTGHITHLSKIILQKALEAAVHWPKAIDLHINISALDLGKVNVIRDFIEIIYASAYPPQSVVFEVTETAVIDTFENISEVFDLIKEHNLRLALDDFGIGFSSLSYLTRIPVTCLKIDKSFTENLKPDSGEEKILKTIKYLCENLEIDCVVEGVETQNHFDQLTLLGLNHMQGYHFSKSLNMQNMAAYLLRHSLNQAKHNPSKVDHLRGQVA